MNINFVDSFFLQEKFAKNIILLWPKGTSCASFCRFLPFYQLFCVHVLTQISTSELLRPPHQSCLDHFDEGNWKDFGTSILFSFILSLERTSVDQLTLDPFGKLSAWGLSLLGNIIFNDRVELLADIVMKFGFVVCSGCWLRPVLLAPVFFIGEDAIRNYGCSSMEGIPLSTNSALAVYSFRIEFVHFPPVLAERRGWANESE